MFSKFVMFCKFVIFEIIPGYLGRTPTTAEVVRLMNALAPYDASPKNINCNVVFCEPGLSPQCVFYMTKRNSMYKLTKRIGEIHELAFKCTSTCLGCPKRDPA